MTKKVINEGFWDNVVTQAKRTALAAGAAMGSKGAEGKLSALNLSTQIYDAYKHYMGATGSEQSAEEMRHFLANDLGFSDNFADMEAEKFDDFLNGYEDQDAEEEPASNQQQPEQKTASDEKQSEEPQSSQKQDEPQKAHAQEPQATQEPKAEEPKEEPKAEPAEILVQDFKKSKQYTDFKGMYNLPKYRNVKVNDPTNYKWEKAQDGSIIYVPEDKMDEFLTILRDKLPPASTAEELHKAGMFTTWQQFRALAPADVNKGLKGSDKEAKFLRDALMAAKRKYGKNFSDKLNRYLVALPNESDEQEPFELAESILMEDLSDKELREYFLKLAQRALKSGEARSAAKKQIRSIKKQKPAQEPAQQTASQQQAAPASQASPSKPRSQQSAPGSININLSTADKALISSFDGTDLPDMISSDDLDVEKLARKILKAAVDDFKTKQK